MQTILSALVTTILFISTPSLSLAVSDLGFASKSPIAFFTPEDSNLFKKALFDMLDQQPDNKTMHWQNPKTEHSGKMKSIKTYTENDLTCRTIKFFNQAGGVKGAIQFNFCKQHSGAWKASK